MEAVSDGSTKHYEEWANKLSNEEMILEQFREKYGSNANVGDGEKMF